MIDVKMMAKSKSGKGGGSSTKTTYIQGTISEAEHATRADKAKSAEKADQADYASKAGEAEKAGFATKSGDVDADAEVLKKFLRKDLVSADHLEEILGKVRFLNDVEFAKGVTFKDAVKFLAGIGSTDINNSGTIKTKNLEVTGLAHFFELIIDKIKSAGGAALFTPADGFDIDLVEEIDGGYRLLWRCQDGDGNQRDNMWRKDDQALCMSFNQAKVGETHNVSNKYYWALVTAVSDSAAPIEKDGEYYNYIEISSSDCDGTVNPEKGDSIVMLGYRGTDDKARQSAIYLSAYSSIDKGLTAPLFAQYKGVDDFDLASHRKGYWDANGAKFIGDVELGGGKTLEDYINDKIGDSKDGKDGKGISSVVTKYYTWNSNTGMTASRIWSYGTTTMPSDFNDNYPWLWSMTRTYYTDGSYEDSNAFCIGYKSKDGSSYKLEPFTETAIVTAEKKLGASLAYYVYLVSGTSKTLVNDSAFTVRYRFDTDSSTTNMERNASGRYDATITDKTYENQDYVEVELLAASGETVLDRRIVPVRYATSASLEVNNTLGTITSRVTGCETSIKNNTADIKNNTADINSQASKIQSNTNSISSIQQQANSIKSTVESNTTDINTLNGKVSKMQTDMSSVTQTASKIESVVSSMEQMPGENIMPGQNGVGWSGACTWMDAGLSIELTSTTEWAQSPPIRDYGGDYLFSFANWEGCPVVLAIYEFDQTYYDDATYDIECDFGAYTVGTILKSSLSYSDSTIKSSYGSGSTTFSVSDDLSEIEASSIVAVRLYNTTSGVYNYIYGTVTAKTSSTVTITISAILYPARKICQVSTESIADGEDICKVHKYTDRDGSERAWIRWKETRGSAKTFVIRARSANADKNAGELPRMMLEEAVEKPSTYAGGAAVSQSMMRQLAKEILLQVNDTYVKVGDGNITLNGDTQVNGNLTLNSEGQGFTLEGDTGKTQISPKSIGSYSNFAAMSQVSMPVKLESNVVGYKWSGSSRYDYSLTAVQKLGTFAKGSRIEFDAPFTSCKPVDVLANYNGTIYTMSFQISIIDGNGNVLATFYQSSANRYVVLSSAAEISVRLQWRAYQLEPNSDYKTVDGTSVINHAAIYMSAKILFHLPTGGSYMLVGYDGLAVNFGTNNIVYIGKDSAVFNYGNYQLSIGANGINQVNRRNVHVVSGTGTTSSPITYTVADGVDTVLCTATNSMVVLPKNPYEGQEVKIFDKSATDCYVNSNGNYVVNSDGYGAGSVWTKSEMKGRVPWTFTFLGGKWYVEYTG